MEKKKLEVTSDGLRIEAVKVPLLELKKSPLLSRKERWDAVKFGKTLWLKMRLETERHGRSEKQTVKSLTKYKDTIGNGYYVFVHMGLLGFKSF